MVERRIGIVLNGVTGRMGTRQHLLRSVLAIMREGGLRAGDDVWMPDPLLVGRNEDKLRALAEEHGPEVVGAALEWSTDLGAAVRDPRYEVVFDASSTLLRPRFIEMAAQAGKAVYCEKPTATTVDEAMRVYRLCEEAGVRHGVVQDKLFLPGIRKLRGLIGKGFFGRVLSVRGEFGYWVFTGHDPGRPAQRPSWNYRVEDGGGIVVDMFCHWRYVLDHLFGGVRGVFARAVTEVPERVDEEGRTYRATADDSAYAVFELEGGVTAQFNSSWCTRVRRDDLLTIQVDGTEGSAVAGLRDCRVQSLERTPRPVWNPDVPQEIDFREGWSLVDAGEGGEYDNAFKVQWEMFLRHVVAGAEWEFGLLEGVKGVQLAELGLQSAREGRMLEVPDVG